MWFACACSDESTSTRPSPMGLPGSALELDRRLLETHVGGTIYDRGVDGSGCRWARVLVCEPPHRLIFSWDISGPLYLSRYAEISAESPGATARR